MPPEEVEQQGQVFLSTDLLPAFPGEWKGTQQLSGLKLETYRRKQNRCGARGAYSAPAPRGYGAQLPGCRETGFSVSIEQLFLFFLAIWFFYLWG